MNKKYQNIITIALLLTSIVSILFSLIIVINIKHNQDTFPTMFFFLQMVVIASVITITAIAIGNKTIHSNNKETLETSDSSLQQSTTEEIKKTIILPKEILPSENSTEKQEKADEVLRNFAKKLDLCSGIFYLLNENKFSVIADYALISDTEILPFELGETLPGQVAKNQKTLSVKTTPDEHAKTNSGLGSGLPKEILFLPIVNNYKTIAILELATFKSFDNIDIQNVENICNQLSELFID